MTSVVKNATLTSFVKEHFKLKGGDNFTKISGRDVSAVFEKCDALYFDGRINKKLRLDGVRLTFKVTVDSTPPEWEFAEYVDDGGSENYLYTVRPLVERGEARGASPQETRVDKLIMTVKTIIIDVMIRLWMPSLPPPAEGWWPGEESLYRTASMATCMYSKYFPLRPSVVAQTSISPAKVSISPKKLTMLSQRVTEKVHTPDEARGTSFRDEARGTSFRGEARGTSFRGEARGTSFREEKLEGRPPEKSDSRASPRERSSTSREILPYRNVANSCYLDSLLVVLLEIPFYRNAIFSSDPKHHPYTEAEVGAVCPARKISIDQFRKLATELKDALVADYEAMRSYPTPSSKSLVCVAPRKLLERCLPAMKGGVVFQVNLVYGALAGVFPEMSMKFPYRVHTAIEGVSSEDAEETPSEDVEETASASSEGAEASFSVSETKYMRLEYLNAWDYFDPLTDVESPYPELLFDKYDGPNLVFFNSGTPRIKIFNSVGKESGFNLIAGDRTTGVHRYSVTKARAFGETIINGRYRLVGVITLEGLAPNREGGTHYTGYFRRESGWYHYNDVGPTITPLERLPEAGVWKETAGKQPSMYFYVKT
jgi:hypothetical protein